MEFEKNLVIDSKCQATLAVKIQKEEIKKEYEKLVLKYSKELALPGFRRGKVPVSVLNAKYSKVIQDDLYSNLIQEITGDIFKNIKPEEAPLFPDEVSFDSEDKFSVDSDYSFTMKYDVRPEVKIVKDEGFVIKIPTIYVSDEDVNQELELIRERNALIKDRGDDEVVSEGDLVTVDYQAFDGETQERQMQDYTFTQSKSSTQYHFESDVLGMKKGETKEIVKSYPEDCKEEYLKGKTRRILITIKTIKEKNLPPLDDELAQDVSVEYKTLDDLKKDIRNKLEKQAKKLMSDEKRMSFTAELAKENPFYIPQSLLMHAFNDEYGHALRHYQISKEELGQVASKLYETVEPKLTIQFQSSFILEALLKKYEISVDDEGIQAFLKMFAEESEVPMDTLQSFLSEPSQKEAVIKRAEERKLLDALYAKSTFEEGEKISLNAYIEKANSAGV